MEETVTQRVNELRAKYGLSILALSKQIKVNQTTLNKQLREDGCGVSIDTVVLMLDAFPGLSAEWLLRGEGDMSKGNDSHTNTENGGDYVEMLKDYIAMLKADKERLQNEVDELKREKSLSTGSRYPMVAEDQEPYVTR